MTRTTHILWALLLLVTGCQAELPLPVVLMVTPDFAYNGADTVVVIEGSSFYPQVEVDARQAGTADVNAGFAARLMSGTTVVAELVSTGLVDFQHIQTVVPAGVEPGRYAVEVEGPTGRIGRLDHAFTVTDTRADRLDVDVDGLLYEVFDTAWVEVALVDPADQRVLSDLPIELSVVGDSPNMLTSIESSGLEDAQLDLDSGVLTGRLGADGRARIGVSVGTPGTTAIRVTPADTASTVADGEVRVLWEPGSELSVDIVLPTEPFTATAGQGFTAELRLYDQFGNPVFDVSKVVLLKNRCETWVDAVTVTGVTPVGVTLREATGTAACDIDSILSVSGPQGESSDIQVRPGPVHRFDVVVNPSDVVAGEDELNIFVTPVDRYGNLTGGTGGVLALTESTGEVLTTSCVGTTPIFCTATPTRSGQQVVLTVDDGTGIRGTSNRHDVLPGPAVVLGAEFEQSVVVAGQGVVLTVDARDRFDNVAILDPLAEVTVTTADGPVSCQAQHPDEGGTGLVCTFTTARPELIVSVEVDGLSADAQPLSVVNGPLAQVVLNIEPRTVTAGEPIVISAVGSDAFGNPYRVQSDPRLVLSDNSQTLSVDELVLGPDGVASTSATVTRAGETVIVSLQDGVIVGASASLRVVAAGAVALDIAPDQPWAFTGEPIDIHVVAQDSFGNTATVSQAATLASSVSAFEPLQVSLVEGRGVAELLYDQPVSETLQASAAGLSDAQRDLRVVSDCDASGPVAVLTVGGADVGIACVDEDDSAVITASLASSTAGGAPVQAGYVVAAAEPINGLVAAPLMVSGVGRSVVRGLVVDTAGCGSEAQAEVWLGLDDGSVTGPVAMSLSTSVLSLGASSAVVTLDGARDCHGELAAQAELFVRTTRGTLSGATPTGAGLVVQLDAAGDAAVTLGISGERTGGTAVVVARTASGSSDTVVPLVVTGDTVKPQVVRVTPAGQLTQPVSSLVVEFTEPMLDTSVLPSSFRVDGPVTTTVTSTVLSADARSVELFVEPAVDPTLGTFSVVATRELRDLSGNRLDGTYTLESFDFSVPLGAVPAPMSGPQGCAVDTFRFRPDGDDGSGAEADGVTLSWASQTTPVWWLVEVRTSAGDRIRATTLVASAGEEQWWWDGRDDSGKISADGSYTMVVSSRDEYGNGVLGCSAGVLIDNEARRER